LMTSFAMIFGMLPTALGLNEGSVGRQALPIAVIGGLVSSTFLTLVVIPVIYESMENYFKNRKDKGKKNILPKNILSFIKLPSFKKGK
jgi:hydrophobic/amphiphilic exporter-1 (mainly G- bacteria), HAE1 family